jgi:hypothetical protein
MPGQPGGHGGRAQLATTMTSPARRCGDGGPLGPRAARSRREPATDAGLSLALSQIVTEPGPIAAVRSDVDTAVLAVTTGDVRTACDVLAPVYAQTAGSTNRPPVMDCSLYCLPPGERYPLWINVGPTGDCGGCELGVPVAERGWFLVRRRSPAG